MRTARLLPLALAAVAAGGCGTGSAVTEEAALRVPSRDLTLQETAAPAVEVASPVELARTPPARPTDHRPRRARRTDPEPRPEPVEPAAATAIPTPDALPHTVQPAAVASATPEPVEPVDPHALAPGATVTIIPASSGPSADPGWTDQRRPDRGRGITLNPGGHGGGCRPRGGGALFNSTPSGQPLESRIPAKRVEVGIDPQPPRR
jgi:hypothetical protein